MGYLLMIKYGYAFKNYNSLEEAEAAAEDMKNVLDNQPTMFCNVKMLEGSEETGWDITPTLLDDTQILNANVSEKYMISNVISGNTSLGIDYTALQERISECKLEFGRHYEVNEIFKLDVSDDDPPKVTHLETLVPQTVDMSVYI